MVGFRFIRLFVASIKQYFFNTSLIKLGSDFLNSLGSTKMRELENIKSGIIGGQLSG